MYAQLIQVGDGSQGIFTMSDAVLAESLKTLSFLLFKHFGQKTILLIDEYDVPLDKGFQAGYYDEILSNVESGEGFGDILIETPERIGVVIEVKYAEGANLDRACQEALAQITRNHYEAYLKEDGMKTIVRYGIAFHKKHCQVVMG